MNKFLSRIDRRYAKVCLYAGVTMVLTLGVCMLLWAAAPVFVKLWQLICAVVEPLVYGAALSYVLNPLVTWVSHRLRRRERYAGPENAAKRRSTAVVLSMALVALALLALASVLVVMVTHSLSSLKWEEVSALLDGAGGGFNELIIAAEARLEEWGLISAESEGNLLTAVNRAKNVATTMVFAVVFAMYLLVDGPRVAAYCGRVARALPGARSLDPSGLIADADRVFSGYFRGQGIDAAIVGALSGIALTAIGVPYAPVVGLLAGLGNLIPYVGGPVGFGSVALMCVPSAAWDKMVWGFVAMALIMFVDGNIINPRLLSDNVEVHPILVVAALIAGGAVGGIAGMLVAVPAAAWIKLQVDRWVARREAEVAEAASGEAPALDDACDPGANGSEAPVPAAPEASAGEE